MKPIIPMEPVLTETIPHGDNWIAQVKWDGVRVLTYYIDQEVRLYNRNLHERTFHYPELQSVETYCRAKSVILDGEVIALGADGKPSFHDVMRRDGLRKLDQVKFVQSLVPVTYMIFDVLYMNGKWIHHSPLQERMELLNGMIEPNDCIQLVSSFPDGHALYEAIKQQGMEGIVLKQLDSPYRIGEKHKDWRKKKFVRDLHAVIGGFTLRDGVVNAVLLGLFDEQGDLRYIGHTGTGKFTIPERQQLTQRLISFVTPNRPFRNQPQRQSGVYWVRPVVTVKIQYLAWTKGRSLRQPVLQALVDVPPDACKLTDV
jgi:bifunctional non-homologous end joining protein LigD